MRAWIGYGLAAVVLVYVGIVLALTLAGRRTDARAIGGFVPDCLVLFKRLLGDDRVPLGSKVLLAATVAYLAMPLDLIPDFIPVAGQADDAVIVALVLRRALRRAGAEPVREHWPGPEPSLAMILRLARARP